MSLARIAPLALVAGCCGEAKPPAQPVVVVEPLRHDVHSFAAPARVAVKHLVLSLEVDFAQKTLEYDQSAYRIGRQDLRSVQQQQQQVQSARMALLRMQSEQLIQRVNLHLALGGSFAEPMTVASTQPQ